MKEMLKTIYYKVLGLYNSIRFKKYINSKNRLRIIVGASKTNYEGWFTTEYYFFDITDENHFKKYFSRKKIDNILAEHVLEHLTFEQTKKAISNFRKYLSTVGNIRIAVPDGFHQDENYIDLVKPNGTGEGSNDHKVLFNYKNLTQIFSDFGFRFNLIEYWDENKKFHSFYTEENGFIKRSLVNDKRNQLGKPVYTSLIVDFFK